MESQNQLPAQSDGQQPPPQQHYSDSALGLVATKSFPAIVGTADMMLKSAEVTLVGYEKIGSGHCTAIVRGKTADVRLAVDEGARTAQQFDQLISKLVIPRPMPNLEAVFPIGTRLAELAQQKRGYSHLSNRAIGLLETRGFPAMVAGADAMLKAADVQLASYETIGEGLCTAIIRGSVANVAMAIEVGMEEAERVGELNAVMVIPRLLEDLEHTLPVASYWLEGESEQESASVSQRQVQEEPEQQKQPLSLPEKEKEQEPEPVQQEETQQSEKEQESQQESEKQQEAEPSEALSPPEKEQAQPQQPETPQPIEENQPLSFPEKEKEQIERTPLSLSKEDKQEQEQEESQEQGEQEKQQEEEEERPLLQLPELEKIDRWQEEEQQQQQQQRQQRAQPPEEDNNDDEQEPPL